MTVRAINKDAFECSGSADLIFTDPPFDMSGTDLERCFDLYDSNHLFLLCSLSQAFELVSADEEWKMRFDCVLDVVTPRKPKSQSMPHYTHVNGIYFTRNNAKSLFSRKLRKRSDQFQRTGYWPTIINAPREDTQTHGMAKNIEAIEDILGSFNVKSVIDPFAGSGATGIAAHNLEMDALLIEKDTENFKNLKEKLRFFDIYTKE